MKKTDFVSLSVTKATREAVRELCKITGTKLHRIVEKLMIEELERTKNVHKSK